MGRATPAGHPRRRATGAAARRRAPAHGGTPPRTGPATDRLPHRTAAGTDTHRHGGPPWLTSTPPLICASGCERTTPPRPPPPTDLLERLRAGDSGGSPQPSAAPATPGGAGHGHAGPGAAGRASRRPAPAASTSPPIVSSTRSIWPAASSTRSASSAMKRSEVTGEPGWLRMSPDTSLVPSGRLALRGSQTSARTCSLGGNHAELFHLREDVDDPPDLSDSAVDEAADEDLVVGDGFAGWREAHVFTLVGPGNRVPADDLVPLFDQILDRNVKVGERAKEHRPHLLERLRPSRASRHRCVEQHVRLDDLVDRLRDELRAALDGVMKAPDRRLVACFLGC